MAVLYETYRVSSLRLEYSTSITTGVSGKFYMYVDGDSKDQPPADIDSFTQQYGCRYTVLWDRGMTYKVPSSLLHRSSRQKLFVRSQTTIPSGDITLYDAATVHVITNPLLISQPTLAGVPVGELWAHYTFEFQTPSVSIPAPIPKNSSMTQYEFDEPAIYTTSSGIYSGEIFADADAKTPVIDGLGLGDMVTGGVTVPTSGKYRIRSTQDVGDVNSLTIGDDEVRCNMYAMVDDGTTVGSVVSTTANSSSTIVETATNYASLVADWIIPLVKGEKIYPLNTWSFADSGAVVGKGSSWAMELLESLSPLLEQQTRESRRTKLKPRQEIEDELKKFARVSESKAGSAPTKDTEDAIDRVLTDEDGRSYVVVRPRTAQRAEVRSYV